ncbi:MAG: PDGLE domain-containing protein [Ilumatobacteraceae bacterium]
MKGHASIGGFVCCGLLVALLLAFVVSRQASSSPDGLVKVAADKSLDTNIRTHFMSGAPLANYSVTGIHDSGLSTGTAGIIGVTITFGAAFGLSKLVRATRSRAVADNTSA